MYDYGKKVFFSYTAESAAEIHRLYGGENFYRSLSGNTGAGWVDSPALMVVGAWDKSCDYMEEDPRGGDFKVFYGGENDIVLITGDNMIYCAAGQFPAVLEELIEKPYAGHEDLMKNE